MLMKRYRVGQNDKTADKAPEQRHKGDNWNHRAIAEFGESVWYMRLAADEHKKLNKMHVCMHDGIWLGIDGRDGTFRIGTSSGAVTARTLQRKPKASRWVQQ